LLTVNCHELSVDEQLALASALSDEFQGRVIALVRDEDIVFDSITGSPPNDAEVERVVRSFIGRRKEAEHYSLTRNGEVLIVHSADPLARARGRRSVGLPPNLLQCPFCGFVTPYQEAYDVHLRSHGAMLGVR
jgi:hypothetical protein